MQVLAAACSASAGRSYAEPAGAVVGPAPALSQRDARRRRRRVGGARFGTLASTTLASAAITSGLAPAGDGLAPARYGRCAGGRVGAAACLRTRLRRLRLRARHACDAGLGRFLAPHRPRFVFAFAAAGIVAVQSSFTCRARRRRSFRRPSAAARVRPRRSFGEASPGAPVEGAAAAAWTLPLTRRQRLRCGMDCARRAPLRPRAFASTERLWIAGAPERFGCWPSAFAVRAECSSSALWKSFAPGGGGAPGGAPDIGGAADGGASTSVGATVILGSPLCWSGATGERLRRWRALWRRSSAFRSTAARRRTPARRRHSASYAASASSALPPNCPISWPR